MSNKGHTSCGANRRASPSAVATAPCMYVFTHVVDTGVQEQVVTYCPLLENPRIQRPRVQKGFLWNPPRESRASSSGFLLTPMQGLWKSSRILPLPCMFLWLVKGMRNFPDHFLIWRVTRVENSAGMPSWCLCFKSSGRRAALLVLRATLWHAVYHLTPLHLSQRPLHCWREGSDGAVFVKALK